MDLNTGILQKSKKKHLRILSVVETTVTSPVSRITPRSRTKNSYSLFQPAIAEWVKIFPRQATETYTSSVTFMKQLTVIAVSTITYLKNIFPEESYTVENFGGIKLRILKKRCRDELAQFVSTALTQAFEAFEKKYLHQLALCFHEGECTEEVAECHIFEYSYKDSGVELVSRRANDERRYTFDALRDRTLHLIKACVVMQSGDTDLPPDYDIGIRLCYNEAAPEGYQAPGFAAGGGRWARAAASALALGTVHTKHHRLAARAFIRDALPCSRDVNPSANSPDMTQNDDEFVGSPDGVGAVRCECGSGDADEDTPMLTCRWCSRRQHAACYGRVAGGAHCCVRCADGTPPRATDLHLAALTYKKRECLSIFRRTLWTCERETEVSAVFLANKFNLSRLNASKLMKLLYTQGIIQTDDDDDMVTPRKIIREQLESVMTKFFRSDENEIADNLMAESLSQPSDMNVDQDPVGDVLAPMEKISIQNATVACKEVDQTTLEPNKVEPSSNQTLQQYRDTLLNNDHIEEQLSLSSQNSLKDKEKTGKKTAKRKSEDSQDNNNNIRTGVRTKRVRKDKQ